MVISTKTIIFQGFRQHPTFSRGEGGGPTFSRGGGGGGGVQILISIETHITGGFGPPIPLWIRTY